MQREKTGKILNIAQVVAWIGCFLIPAITSVAAMGFEGFSRSMMMSLRLIGPLCVLYFLNYCFLVPNFLFGEKPIRKWFYIVNFIIIAAFDLYILLPRGQWGPVRDAAMGPFSNTAMTVFHVMGIVTRVSVQVVVVALAVGIRSIIRSNELLIKFERERRNAAEAELSWLKHQLNPHFLFNTLNNISSLVQIDADKAQDCIGQLSDLLRYALYDSEKEMVPITGEVEFMKNYIALMQLRCGSLTVVNCNFDIRNKDVEIAPLLFISLIENAFKHGVNARKDSVVNIEMCEDGPDLVFNCNNTLFEKQQVDRIGSGIGLENLRRRLDLIYPGNSEFTCGAEDGMYKACVRLKNVVK